MEIKKRCFMLYITGKSSLIVIFWCIPVKPLSAQVIDIILKANISHQ